MTRMFELRGASKIYDRRTALAEVDLRVDRGVHTAILGPSGSGKSTVLRLLAGLTPPTAGQVLLDGQVVSASGRVLLPPHRRGIAMVFQDLALWPHLSVRDNVLLGLSGSDLCRRERRERAHAALELCRIASLSRRRPGEISGGQQQRVALARAIAVRPTFLFLDEPFSGLDPVTKYRVLKDISGLAAEQGLTILLVTHEPREAEMLCSAAVVLEEGHVVESGALEDLLREAGTEMLRVFRDQRR